MAKVTVVIPYYNNHETILNTYDSVLNQTYKDLNIVIVNDGSNEETIKILRILNNENLTIINQKNQGVVTARNNGIEKAESDFILTLDADDHLEPTFLEKSVKILEKEDKIGVVTSNYNVFSEKGFLRLVQLENSTKLSDFLEKNRIPSNALFRKKCWSEVNGYDTLFNLGYEDWDFWLSIVEKGWKFKIIEEPLLNIIIRSKSRNREAMMKDLELKRKIYTKHSEFYKDNFLSFIDSQLNERLLLKQTIRKRDNSIEMRIGKSILLPIRKLKKIFS